MRGADHEKGAGRRKKMGLAGAQMVDVHKWKKWHVELAKVGKS